MNKFEQAREQVRSINEALTGYAGRQINPNPVELLAPFIDQAEADAKRVAELEAEREMLVKIACAEQKRRCVAVMPFPHLIGWDWKHLPGLVGNTTAPSLSDVLAKMSEVRDAD